MLIYYFDERFGLRGVSKSAFRKWTHIMQLVSDLLSVTCLFFLRKY
jgi:hypothetical protein